MAATMRPARPEDEAFLFKVFASSRAPELAPLPWDDAQKQAFLAFQFKAQQQHYRREFVDAEHYIVIDGEEPVGRLYVDRRADEIRILDVALLPAHRGRGIGGMLLRPLLAEAEATGKPVRIYVEHYQQQALRVFEHLGFAEAADHGISTLMEWTPDAGR